MATFHEITKYMHDNLYWIGIWDDPDVWVMPPYITGVKYSGVSSFFNIEEWDITQ
jgi:hypothetical protein